MRPQSLVPLLLLLPTALTAQFDLTAGLVEARYSAHATAPGLDGAPYIQPLADLGPSLEVGLRRGLWRLSVGGSLITYDLALSSGEGGVTTPDVLKTTSVTVQIGRPILRHGGGKVELAVGAIGTRWSFVDLEEPARWRWGPVGSLSGVMPLSHALGVVSRLALSRSHGAFDDSDLPEGFSSTSSTRFEWSIGFRLSKP